VVFIGWTPVPVQHTQTAKSLCISNYEKQFKNVPAPGLFPRMPFPRMRCPFGPWCCLRTYPAREEIRISIGEAERSERKSARERTKRKRPHQARYERRMCQQHKDTPGCADPCVEPEGARHAQHPLEDQERVGENKARHHSGDTATDTARPRIRLGNSSAISTQTTGARRHPGQARFARREKPHLLPAYLDLSERPVFKHGCVHLIYTKADRGIVRRVRPR
jgi:hypothetical protein